MNSREKRELDLIVNFYSRSKDEGTALRAAIINYSKRYYGKPIQDGGNCKSKQRTTRLHSVRND